MSSQKYLISPAKVKKDAISMRFLIKKLCLILMAMALIVTSLPITSFANGPDTDQGGTITISNVTPGDTFKALKIIDVAYDDNSKNITQNWNPDLGSMWIGSNQVNNTPKCSVEEYIAMDAKAKSALIDPIKSFFMNTNGEGSLTVKSADENGIVTFNIENSIGWGSYLILCNSEGKEDNYSDMVGSVQPVWNTESDTWEIIGDEIVAKKTVLNLSYQVSTAEDGTYSDGVNAGSWNTLYYQIESDVPQYDSSVEAKNRKFIIENTIAEGITAPTDANIKAYGSIDGTNFEDINITSSVSSDKISFDLTSAMSDDKYTKIRIQYNTAFEKASDRNQGVSDKVILGNTGNSSTVKATYNNYDGTASDDLTEATATVYTYGLEIMATNRNSPMSDIKFKVYKSAEAEETDLEMVAYNNGDQPEQINSVLLSTITSGNNGIATYRGLKNDIDYYIQDENEELLPIAEKIDTNDDDRDGFFEYTVKKPVITLPETGGRGTMIFTFSGISLMVSAIVLLFIIKKRVTTSK